MQNPKGLQWNKNQLLIAMYLQQDMTPKEIEDTYEIPKRTVYKVKNAMKKGDDPGPVTQEMIDEAPEPMVFGETEIVKENDGEVTPGKKGTSSLKVLKKSQPPVHQTTAFQLVAQTQQIPMTTGIYVSYMVAVKHGYTGGLSEWLDLVSTDFWQGRDINMYAEMASPVGGIVAAMEGEKEEELDGTPA